MKYLRVLLSIILSVAFAVILSGGIFAYTIRSFVSKENMREIVSGMGIETLLTPNAENHPELFENYLEIPEVQELVERLGDQSVDYIIDNKELPSITDADIDSIINSDYYARVLGISLPEQAKEIYSDYLKETFLAANETIVNKLSPIKTLFENDLFKIFLSNSTIPVMVILLIILTGLIGVCRWNWYRPLSWVGTATMVAGGSCLILNFLVRSILSEALNNVLINALARRLSTKWVGNGLIILCVGIVILIGYAVINTIIQRRIPDEEEPNELAAFPRNRYDTNHIAADIRRIRAVVPSADMPENQPEETNVFS